MATFEDFQKKLREKIKPFFKTFGAHGFDHTERVFNLATHLAKIEKADLETVQVSALLHDIARQREDNGEVSCHAEHGSKQAVKLLQEFGFPKEKIFVVEDAIYCHRYKKGLTPKTLEGKIVQDADRLEALGAIAIARIFARGGETGLPLHDPLEDLPGKQYKKAKGCLGHFEEKILKIKPEKFHTKTAQELARHRYEFTQNFTKEFLDEWQGKK